MHPNIHFSIKLLILIALTVIFQWSFAQDLPHLPEAFDAGWKGEKPCQVLYETDSMRVARCSFAPGIGHEKHFHYPHFGYVLEGGTMSITNEAGETQVRQVTTGKSWSTSEITIHEAVNTGDKSTSYLIIEPRLNEAQSDQLKSQ